MTESSPLEHTVSRAFGLIRQAEESLEQGDLALALSFLQEGLLDFCRLAESDPQAIRWQTQMAHCQLRIGTVLLRQGSSGALAQARFAASRQICVNLLAPGTASTGTRGWAAMHLGQLCDVMLTEGGDPEAALENCQLALDIWRSLAAEEQTDGYDAEVATNLIRVGIIRQMQSDLNGALERVREALVIRRKHAQAGSCRSEWQASLALAHAREGVVLDEMGDLEAALAAHRSALTILRELATAEPDNTDYLEALGFALKSIGDIAETAGTLHEALEHREQCVSIWRRLVATGRGDAALLGSLASTLEEIANLRYRLEDLPGALGSSQEAQLLWQQLVAEKPTRLECWEMLGASHARVGDLMEQLEDPAAALRCYQQSVTIWRDLVARERPTPQWQQCLALVQERLEELTWQLMSSPDSLSMPGTLH